jgi:hypothetical protein
MSAMCLLSLVLSMAPQAAAPSTPGSIRGTVSLAQNNDPVHGATVLVTELRRTACSRSASI